MGKTADWQDFVDWSQPLTEETFWEAVAEAKGCDVSEISDGDPIEWL